ncbi:MAG: MFS transporter, partial [Chlorobi bacterium]|nr:MFS transporter [Chlorobiota bacterium]
FLIGTYFTLTVAELFLSPMGLSFVAKVSPPKMRGLMQGGWLAATAIGNYAAGYVGRFYQSWELWQFFLLLVVLAAVSGFIMFSILKIVNRASTS